jgi:hypothetical protein
MIPILGLLKQGFFETHKKRNRSLRQFEKSNLLFSSATIFSASQKEPNDACVLAYFIWIYLAKNCTKIWYSIFVFKS